MIFGKMHKNPEQREFARQLRKNMTDAERWLWGVLRCEQLHGFKFRRQAAIGDFVVDFVCFARKLIVELDGGQHAEEEAKIYDANRTAWLNSQGFRVVRFWNQDEFENLDGITDVIWKSLEETNQPLAPPPPRPSPPRGRSKSHATV